MCAEVTMWGSLRHTTVPKVSLTRITGKTAGRVSASMSTGFRPLRAERSYSPSWAPVWHTLGSPLDSADEEVTYHWGMATSPK